VVEADTYFLKLVWYLHLNPLRARLVPDLPHLARYPGCGHAWIRRRETPPWQARAFVLAWFGRPERRAVRQRADRGRADARILGRGAFEAEMRRGGRRRRLSALRAQLAVHLVTRLGLSLAEGHRHLGISTSRIAKAVGRAEAQ
jgi:hypothetical protein